MTTKHRLLNLLKPIMKALIGVDGLIWAQPVADVLSLAVVILMLCRKIRKTEFSTPEVIAVNE